MVASDIEPAPDLRMLLEQACQVDRPNPRVLGRVRVRLELLRVRSIIDSRRVVALVDSYGLPRDQRLDVCRELEHAPTRDERVELRFSRFDQARVVTVANASMI